MEKKKCNIDVILAILIHSSSFRRREKGLKMKNMCMCVPLSYKDIQILNPIKW